jgi:tetratricopeptide (TPR) repeat protein
MAKKSSKHRAAPARADAVGPGELLRQASGVLASDPAQAEVLARQALDADPGSVDARSVLGAALRRKGDLSAALAVLTRLTAAKSCPWIVHFELAQTMFALGQSRAAVTPLREVVELNPGWTPAWRLLGDILMAGGDFAGARVAYDRRVRSMIRDPQLKAAANFLIDGRLDDVERETRAVLAAKPSSLAAAEHLLAEALRRKNQMAKAERVLLRCLAKAPGFYSARVSLAQVLFGQHRFADAATELDRLLEHDANDTRCLMMKATVVAALDRHDEVLVLTAALLDAFPDQPRAWLVHANTLRTLGRIAEALAAYLKALELDPDFAEVYWSLANLKTYRFTPHQRAAMERLLARKSMPAKDGAELNFALARAFEDDKAYAKAFERYSRGNAIERKRRAYDREAVSEVFRKTKAAFTADFFKPRSGWGAVDPDPIFIVGLPRSGSTLVEQILASHPLVEGTHELIDLPIIVASIPNYPEAVAALSRDRLAELGETYVQRTRAYRHLGRPRFTDKRPGNFMNTGLIELMLPNAKIIDVRRHPLACCVSNFRQHFAAGFECSYDLNDLGRYYADYVDLMAHFDDVLPGRVHRVIYEDLVADTEMQVRSLLSYLDLQFDPACLSFFDNERAVATPSSQQVRQPIFTDGLDQWRHFEPWLGPLKSALGPALDAYPAAPLPAGQSAR